MELLTQELEWGQDNMNENKQDFNLSKEDFGIPEEILAKEKQWFLHYDQNNESIILDLRQSNHKSKR